MTKQKTKQKTFNKLYDHNKNPETSIQGTGYGTKKKAQETLKIIKDLPLVKQKQIVITMYYRAKHHKNHNKNMKQAMEVFKPWMKKHNIKTKSRKKSANNSKSNKLINCCKSTNKNKKCIRKKDNKIFTLPRRFTKKKCVNNTIRGFSMTSSCAPYIEC